VNGEERDRLIKLEVLFKERWNAHDKRSDEMWGYITTQLSKLDDLPCKVNAEKIKGINIRFGLLWSVLVLAVTVLGLAIKLN